MRAMIIFLFAQNYKTEDIHCDTCAVYAQIIVSLVETLTMEKDCKYKKHFMNTIYDIYKLDLFTKQLTNYVTVNELD